MSSLFVIIIIAFIVLQIQIIQINYNYIELIKINNLVIKTKLLINGRFDQNVISGSYEYKCPSDWECSNGSNGSDGGIVIVSRDDGSWGGGGTGCDSNYYLTLQAYNNNDLCYISQEVMLKPKKYILSFMGRSRGSYPNSNLHIKIDNEIVFKQTLSHTWTSYNIIIHSKTKKNVNIIFANNDIDYNFASQISCVDLVEA